MALDPAQQDNLQQPSNIMQQLHIYNHFWAKIYHTQMERQMAIEQR